MYSHWQWTGCSNYCAVLLEHLFIILNCNNPVSKLDWFYWIPIWTSQTKTGIEDLQKLLLKMGGKGPPIEGSSTNLDTNAAVVKVSTHTNHPISVRGIPVESPIGVTPALASMMQPNHALWPGFSTKAQYKGVATQSLPQPNSMATIFTNQPLVPHVLLPILHTHHLI